MEQRETLQLKKSAKKQVFDMIVCRSVIRSESGDAKRRNEEKNCDAKESLKNATERVIGFWIANLNELETIP